jgi:hypothetical protein
MFAEENEGRGRKTILVALDFSECSKAAFRKACDMFQDRLDRIIALHMVDSDFVKRCVANRLGKKTCSRKPFFLDAYASVTWRMIDSRHVKWVTIVIQD